jgi:ribonucleoside-diphosphate reductase alpha chain
MENNYIHTSKKASYVIKRNGQKQAISFDKITERISKLINPIQLQHYENLEREDDYLDPVLVAQKVITNLYSGISTQELDLQSAIICQNLSSLHSSYSKLGGRILVSNLHKNTLNSFSEKVKLLSEKTNILNLTYKNFVLSNNNELDMLIDYNRDYLYDYFGFKTLEKAYLQKINGVIVERPQDMLMRTAITLNVDYDTHTGDLKAIKETYDLMSLGYYTHATPTLYNSGTNYLQLSSCFLGEVPDNLKGIEKSWINCAEISRWAGGIGLSVSKVRGKGSIIKTTGENSNGLVPLLKMYDQLARYVNQGGKRPGSIAIYLEPHHPDIFDFLELRKNFGDDTQRARDLFLALWIPDVYMKQVEVDGDWYLLCPNECPYLSDVYGDEFEELYWKYVNEGKYKSKVSARKLWLDILESQIETGMPYIGFKDAVNKKNNQKNLGTIKNSNLCVHGETKILTDEGYKIIQDLENTKINVWNGNEWSKVEVKKTGTNKNLIRINLSNGAYIDCTPEHKFYIYDEKSQILEISADKLQVDYPLIKFDLPEAFEFTNNVEFKHTSNFTVPLNANINDRLRWLEEYVDINGVIARNEIDDTLQIYSIEKEFLIDIRYMLHTLGIDSEITEEHHLFDSKNSYKLLISSFGLYKLSKLGFKPNKLTLTEKEPPRDTSYIVRVVSIEESYKNVDTYCFTEPKRNKGMFNGILTGQCIEIVQYSSDKEYAVCNLASISLRHFVKQFVNDKTNKWIIYSKPNCKFCSYAKKFFAYNKYDFEEIEFSIDTLNKLKTDLGQETITFPQIFLGETHIGGWNELYYYTAGVFDYDKLYDVAYMATVNLNKVIDINFYPIPETKLSNMKHRPIGLGIQGLADTLALMRIPFDSDTAVDLNAKIMETIYLASITASNDLSKSRCDDFKRFNQLIDNLKYDITRFPEFYENKSCVLTDSDIQYYNFTPEMIENVKELYKLYHKLKPNIYEITNLKDDYLGAYSSFNGSFFSEGKFQFDLWNVKPTRPEWNNLGISVQKYGTRNSLLTALMPTASTSQILGNNECFEYFTNNIYTRNTQAGDFVVINKYLVSDLLSVGLWDVEMKDRIIANNGSIQKIETIPIQIRNLYKIIWEIGQKWVLKSALARSPYIDQTQSMNLFMGEPDFQRLGSSHMWAWKNGLKTGQYYLRTKPASDAIKFTIDPNLIKQVNNAKDAVCDTCSA